MDNVMDEDFPYVMMNPDAVVFLFALGYEDLHNEPPKVEPIPEEPLPLPPLYYSDDIDHPAMSLFDEVTDYDYHPFHKDPRFNWFPNDGLSKDEDYDEDINDNSDNSDNSDSNDSTTMSMMIVPMSQDVPRCKQNKRKQQPDNLWNNFMLYKEFDPVLGQVNFIYNKDYDLCYPCFKRMKNEIEERNRREMAILSRNHKSIKID